MSFPADLRRRTAPCLLALLPAALAGVLWTGVRFGLLGDRRTRLTVTALVTDWLLVTGTAASLVLVAALQLARRSEARRQRSLSAAAEQAALERRLLLARLDHELKNPLMAVRAAAANLASAGSGEDRSEALRSIDEQVLRLARLTGGLRKIADIGTAPLERRRLDVAALVEEAVELVRDSPACADRRISVDLPRAPWPLPAVDGDGDLLSLALVNVLDNAVKHTPASAGIEVRARDAAGQVVVEVADTGPGISEDELPWIWQELYRGASSRGVPGSGLGLPLVRAVVERHGGSVSAVSRVGQGTAVRLALPAVDAPAG